MLKSTKTIPQELEPLAKARERFNFLSMRDLVEIKEIIIPKVGTRYRLFLKDFADNFRAMGDFDSFSEAAQNIKLAQDKLLLEIRQKRKKRKIEKIKNDIYDLVASGDVDDSIIEAMEAINETDELELINLIKKYMKRR